MIEEIKKYGTDQPGNDSSDIGSESDFDNE